MCLFYKVGLFERATCGASRAGFREFPNHSLPYLGAFALKSINEDGGVDRLLQRGVNSGSDACLSFWWLTCSVNPLSEAPGLEPHVAIRATLE